MTIFPALSYRDEREDEIPPCSIRSDRVDFPCNVWWARPIQAKHKLDVAGRCGNGSPDILRAGDQRNGRGTEETKKTQKAARKVACNQNSKRPNSSDASIIMAWAVFSRENEVVGVLHQLDLGCIDCTLGAVSLQKKSQSWKGREVRVDASNDSRNICKAACVS